MKDKLKIIFCYTYTYYSQGKGLTCANGATVSVRVRKKEVLFVKFYRMQRENIHRKCALLTS